MFKKEGVNEKELEKLFEEGRIIYTPFKKIKIGRWILKEKIGDFIGCKSKTEGES